MSSAPGFSYDPSTADFQGRSGAIYRALRDEHPVHHDEVPITFEA